MQQQHNLLTRKMRNWGVITSSILLLLLAWQISFKAAAIESGHPVVSQYVVDNPDLSFDHHDFDPGILSSSSNDLSPAHFADYPDTQRNLFNTPAYIPHARAPPVYF